MDVTAGWTKGDGRNSQPNSRPPSTHAFNGFPRWFNIYDVIWMLCHTIDKSLNSNENRKMFYNCFDLSSGSGVKRSADGAGDGGPNRFWFFLIAASVTAWLPGKWLPLKCSSWAAFPLGWCPTKTEPALRLKQRRSRLPWLEARASTVANRFPQVSSVQHFCNFNNLSQHSFSLAPLMGKSLWDLS